MRKFIVPVLAALLGATVVPVITRSAFVERPSSPRGASAPGAIRSAPLPAAPSAIQDPHANAWKLLRAGHLQEAQDAFLEILSLDANNSDALHGLVVVRQSMARNDPQLLRRQAAEYWNAIKRGVDTQEHYTRRAMEQLIVANVQAAREIEARGAPASRASRSTTRPGTPSAGPQPNDKLPAGEELLSPTGLPAKPAGPQTPPTSARKLPPPATSAAKPAEPLKPRPPAGKVTAPPAPPAIPVAPQTSTASGEKVPPPTAIAVAPQTSTPTPQPAQKGAEVPPTSPALQKLGPGAPAATTPIVPPGPSSSAAPVQKGAEVPPTSPALQKLPGQQAPAAPTSTPPPDNRLYMVRVGPISDRDRASAVAKQLVAGGFSQTKVTTQTGFRVVSEPLPRGVAETISATLAGRGVRSQVEALTGDTVQLLFGSFTSQRDAETLSRRVAAAGYDAQVREATVYTLQLGPYPQSSVNTITGIVKSGAPGATLTTTPVP